MADQKRDRRGRFATTSKRTSHKECKPDYQVDQDHNYVVNEFVEVCSSGKERDRCGWKVGRRVVEFSVLVEGLKFCKMCRLGPIPLCEDSVVGELKKGLGGYLYVKCLNCDCNHVNCVPYGTLVQGAKERFTKPSSFAVNTKLGTAMIDSLGGPQKVNNMLAALNIPTISNSNLKKMERRAGKLIEKVASDSMKAAAQDAYRSEMEDIALCESAEAEKSVDVFDEDLGVSMLPGASPMQEEFIKPGCSKDIQWTGDVESPQTLQKEQVKNRKPRFTVHCNKLTTARKSLAKKFPCKTRTGISCAVDTAWQKRGFDSLTSHTFFMSKAKYGKRVLKAIVKHRICGTCNWWKRNRPGVPVRQHRCVRNHAGSARLMESASGEQGILDLKKEGVPVEYIEGDGDNTLISRLRVNQNINMKKRFDRNHVVKMLGNTCINFRLPRKSPLANL
ncbi:hypothetical protein ACF0H5_004872 [Mactra antiquata]